MIADYKSKANLLLGVGIVLNVGVRIISASGVISRPANDAVVYSLLCGSLLGSVLFVYGCVMYARAKNRNGWWGAFGLLSILGLIVLVCLRDDAPDGFGRQQRGFAPVMRGNGGPPPRR